MPWRYKFKTNEEYNKWYRDYREKNREKMREYYREYNKNWRKKNGYHNEEKWDKNNHLKVLTQGTLQRAVKKGLIEKLPCIICGDKKSIAHHEDYSQPYKVFWLCSAHHKARHQRKISLKTLKEFDKLKRSRQVPSR